MAQAGRSRSLGMTILLLLLIAVPGFGLGLVFGVAWEEPGLLGSHLLGGTTEVAAWSPRETTRDPDAELAPVVDEPPALPEVSAEGPPEPPPPARRAAAPPRAPAPQPSRAASSAMPPEPPPVPAGAPGRFAVQVGAFGEATAAERLAGQLRDKGYPVYVSPGVAAGEPRWRVRVGPLPAREQAEAHAARLKSAEQLPTWVLDESSGG